MEKRLALFLFFVLAVSSIFYLAKGITGNMITECPEGYILKQGYCINPICSTGQVECDIENNFMKPRDCTCVAVMGKFLCGVLRQEETAVKSPLCIRRGQLGIPCGHYDPQKDVCVPN